MEHRRHFVIVTAMLVALWLFGVAGYMVIEGWSLLDSFYMTAITLSTVGYGEVHPLDPAGRIFTVVLLVWGTGTFFYAVGVITDAFFEGHLKGLLEKRRMDKAIGRLSNHYIICGFGRIGRTIAKVFQEKGIPVVIVERDQEVIKEVAETGFPFIQGDATKDEVLVAAGVKRAKGIICVLRSDADNVYITLTARSLNPGLMIETRASDHDSQRKMIQAGANHVISPYEVGARRMALAVLQPTVTEFLDLAVHSAGFDLTVEQIEIAPGSALDGVSIKDAAIRARTGCTVLAVQQPSDRMILALGPDYVFSSGETMVALGTSQGLIKLKELAQGPRESQTTPEVK